MVYMYNKSIKISKKELLIFISVIPYLKPDFFSYVPIINNAYLVLKYVFLVILILSFVSAWIGKKIKLHAFSVLLFALNLLPILRMLSVSGWSGEPIKQFIDVVALILIVEINQNYWRMLIRALMVYFEIIVYLNFITILLFPNGLYHEGLYMDNWILGYANSEVKYLILAGLVSIIYGYLSQSKMRSILLCGIAVISLLKLGSITGIIGLITMCILYLLQRRNNSFFNLKNIAIVVAICFIYFIVEQNVLNYVDFIAELTGKTVTFTSRFNIWEKTILFWLNNPLLGLGWKSSLQRGIEYNNIYATNAHNTFLEYLYLGGVVELIIFIMVIYAIYRVGNEKQDIILEKVIYACVGGFLVMMLTESYTTPVIQLIYLICYFAAKNTNININNIKNKAKLKMVRLRNKEIKSW